MSYEELKKNTDDSEKKRNYVTAGVVLVALIALAIIITVAVVTDSSSSHSSTNYETMLLDSMNTTFIANAFSVLCAQPHVAGSERNSYLATYVEKSFANWGLSSQTNSYDILSYDYGNSSVELLDKSTMTPLYRAVLAEPIIPNIPSTNTSYRTQAWFGYAPPGDVKGDLVYVNYANNQDFEALVQAGIKLSGKIGIARYGTNFRGLKVWNAQRYGLIALIVYSDPIDDGFVNGDVYPNGPWRPTWSFQRGSVQYSFLCPGNPNTSRTEGKCKMTYDDVTPGIPALPMSWGDAQHLMAHLSGQAVNESIFSGWQGGIPNITVYHIGGNNQTWVHLQSKGSQSTKTIYNVISVIPASVATNETIIFGNHRDAWVYGASDPSSGTTALLSIARGFAEIWNKGWKPTRNLMFCSWDDEEFGLIGSTAFAEDTSIYASWKQHAVLYLNVDVATAGPNMQLQAFPHLKSFIVENLKTIVYPYQNNSQVNLFDMWIKGDGANGLSVLGSGSDYVAFAHSQGINSLDAKFYGTYGTYHSVYDDLVFMSIVDPQHLYVRALAQFFAAMGYQLGTQTLLPFNLTDLYSWANTAYQTLTQSNALHNCMPSSNMQSAMQNALNSLQEQIISFQNKVSTVSQLMTTSEDSSEVNSNVAVINQVYINIAKEFLIPEGLANRFYFKNSLFAPSLLNGYAPQNYPIINDVLSQVYHKCNSTLINSAFNQTAFVFQHVTTYLEQQTAKIQI